VRLAVELVGAQAGILGLISPDGESIDAPYAHNLPPALESIRSLPKGQGIAWRIVTTGLSVLLPDYESHPNALPTWVAAGIRGFIGVPVMAGKTMLGAAVLISLSAQDRFTERDLALAEAVGRQAGIAIENARLFEAEQRRVALLTTLREISLDLSAQLDLPKLLETILERIGRLLATQRAAV